MTPILMHLQRMLMLLSAFWWLGASAVPAKRTYSKHRQPDGTTITITVRGDENFHFECTLDGLPVVQRHDGAYCYARRSAYGTTIEPTQQLAHDAANRTTAEKTFVATNTTELANVRAMGHERANERNATRMARLRGRGTATPSQVMARQQMAGATGGDGIGITGQRRGLVILVNFQDVKMQDGHDNAAWSDFFNLRGYNAQGNAGSVHDYFYAQSYGLFDLSFDVVGPVTVSKDMAYYGGNDKSGNDKNPVQMAYEACQLADPYVNFADYDWDGDGEADQVFVVYAGYGEASNPKKQPDTIWPHEWKLTAKKYNQTLDGVRIDTYACSQELYGDSGTKMDGIGTACHEFSHCLGIPDMYDTSGDNYGMSEWDLMDYGSYGGDGYCPVGFNTYERWVSGWLQPTTLDSGRMVSGMKPLADKPEAYVVLNDRVPTEYYILENRQLSGFDASLPAHGLLVIHVDYDEHAWKNNTINNTASHQRFTIVPADNDLSRPNGDDEGTNAGDTYPGTSGNTCLTDYSAPAATLFNANTDGRRLLGKPITDITESADGLIAFRFMGGRTIDSPTAMQSDITDDTSFDASWAATDGADSYDLQLRKATATPTYRTLVAEDFRTWGNGLSADSNTDISASLDNHMACKGWTGTKIYAGPGRMKIGTSKASGLLTSPTISDAESDVVAVSITSDVYGSDKAETIVTLNDLDGNKIDADKIVPDGSKCLLLFDNPDHRSCKLTIQPSKRCYLYAVDIASPATTGTTDIKGVSQTSHTFAQLEAGATYQWRVQAVADGSTSAWTPWQTVDLSDSPTAIQDTAIDSGIPTDAHVDVYSPDGTPIGRMTYAQFLNANMHSGIYIMMYGGKAYKMVR